MKIPFLILLLSITGAVFDSVDAQSRVWTRNDGNTVEAGISKASQNSVTLKLKGGSDFEVRLSELVEADRAYVAAWLTQQNNRPAKEYFMSFWAYTRDEPYAGTNSLDMYLEINGDRALRYQLPTRNFARNGVEAFTDIPVRIDPSEVKTVRMVVTKGDDLWEAKQATFQFGNAKLVSEKMDFPVRRTFSMDDSEGIREFTFKFERPVELNLSTQSPGDKEVEVIRIDPAEIANHTRGSTKHAPTGYVIESDQSRGTLEMEFKHRLIESSLAKLTSAVLVMQVPNVKNADTDSTIAIWSGRKSLATKKGATRGQTLRIAIDPQHLNGKRSIILTVKCGDNAVIIASGAKDPFLEATFD